MNERRTFDGWNEAWKAARARRPHADGEAWSRRAPSFARHAARSGYVERVLELIDARPEWTGLDVGCGSGALAIPLARRLRSVDALDFSAGMLDQLRSRCAAEGLGNVKPILGAWEDDWNQLCLGSYDLVLASRSLNVEDLRAALLKLHRAARCKVVVSAPVGAGPIDPRIMAAAGRDWRPGPDFLYPLNVLHELGIEPSVSFIPVAQARTFADVTDAVEGVGWMLTDPTPDELARLRRWLERELSPSPDGLLLQPRTVVWAVLSWAV
ncbi:MAG TPA: class I SAM-dependent methyltransferase [Myxococcales bacterium]|nr:class I SAM-dependent methyltransferase [Myxococcales bacterium]